MTWHQWQAAYPTLSNTGTFLCFASAKASSHQGHQSTGLSLCCNRYGLVDSASRFATSLRLGRAEAADPIALYRRL